MKFHIGNIPYRVEICPGPLIVEGESAAGMSHGDVILLCGTLDPRRRLGVLIHQLYGLQWAYYGHLTALANAKLTAQFLRRLEGQGGERALMRLRPTPTKKRPGRKQDLRRGKGAR